MKDKTPKILWCTRHKEFAISDYYYFSKLQKHLAQKHLQWEEKKQPLSSKLLATYDIVVLCYPEEPLSPREVRAIERFMEEGGRVIVTAYFRCPDDVAGICSLLTQRWGIRFRGDVIRDPLHCLEGDPLLLYTSRISTSLKGVSQVFFPCSSSLEIKGEVTPLIIAEASAQSDCCGGELALGAIRRVGKGDLIALGTSVFWDNFSLDQLDNRNLCDLLFRINPKGKEDTSSK